MNKGIGKKIIELRKEQRLTQEDLADLAGVSTRTIQRIEQDEVQPRGDTLNALAVALDYDFDGAPVNDRLDKTLLLLLQVSNIFIFILLPIGVLIWNNRMSKDLEREAKKAINFQLNYLLGIMVILLLFVVSPFFVPLLPAGARNATWISLAILLSIIPIAISGLCLFNMIKISETTIMRYPKGIRFIK